MRDEERQQASRDALERAAREFGDDRIVRARALGATRRRPLRRPRRVGERDGTTDPAELWGRRIGRALSLLGVVLLAYWLGVQARWW